MFSRKIFWVFAVITVLAVVVIILSGNISISDGSFQEAEVDIKDINEMIGNPIIRVFASFVSFLVILVVLATAGLIPNMFIRGRAEYFLSKPVSRTGLLLNKFFGIWFSYGVLVVVCGAIGYCAMYLVHGVAADNLIWVFVLNLVSLFIWLSVTSFAGIVFGSTTMAIVTAALIWFTQWLLQWHEYYKEVISSKAITGTIDVLYYIIPKTGELSDLTVQLALGRNVDNWLPLYGSLIFAIVLLGATLAIFNRKNY